MARILFSGLVDEIIGKLGGSVFQYSYGGYQVHVKGKPRNPQSQYQQLRRGDFGFLSASWRNLSPGERTSFISNAPTGVSGLSFFITTNVNLILISEPTVSTFVPAATPTDMPIEITDVSPTSYMIRSSGGTTIVPADTRLLIYSTNVKFQTRVFTNPSEYSPIINFDEGTDMSTATSILAEFNTRFGQIRGDKLIGLKSVLIHKTTGERGLESITSSNTETMANKFIPLTQFNADVISTGVALETFYTYIIPANSLQSIGDRIRAVFNVENTLLLTGNTWHITLTTGGSALNVSNTAPLRARINLELQMTAADEVKIISWYEFNSGIIAMETTTVGGINPLDANTIELTGGSNTAGTMTAKFGSVDLIRI